MNRVVNSSSALGLVFAVIFAIVAVTGLRLIDRIDNERFVTVEELYDLTDEELAEFQLGEDPTDLLLDGAGLSLVLKGEYPREVTGEIDEDEIISRLHQVQRAVFCSPSSDIECQPLVDDDKLIFDFINQTLSDWYMDNSEGKRCMISSAAYHEPNQAPVESPLEATCN